MRERLEAYLDLLREYGKVADLSSARVLEYPDRQLRDALAYGEVLPTGAEVLDLGSGAGWPAIPLAIARPDLTLVLVERRQKRAAFLSLVVAKLNLTNVRVHADDVRTLRLKVNHVTAQAVAPFPDVYRSVRHLARLPLVLVSRKGEDWTQEVEALAALVPAEVFHVKRLEGGGSLVAVRVGEG